MKNFSKYLLIILLSCTNVFASSSEGNDFNDVFFGKGYQCTRKDSPIYLECYFEKTGQDPTGQWVSLRSFEIYKKPKKNKTLVGKIGVKLNNNEEKVEIGSLEIYPEYRRKGYGEQAMHTILGIYRSSKNESVSFTHFYLTVGLFRDREAARNLYVKLGFEVSEYMENIGYQNMILPR